MATVVVSFEQIKDTKCLDCKKKDPIAMIVQYIVSKDELEVAAYCKDCFKRNLPDYTLENKCIVCGKNFKCGIQNSLFSKKEIKAFKDEFWGNNDKK